MKLLKELAKKIRRAAETHKKAATAALCALIAAGTLAAVELPTMVTASTAARELPIYSVERDQKMIALSFDAAWGNEDTETLIHILGKYNVKATFFVIGRWAEKYPESVKALSDAGHEVMNHSDDHAHFNTLSADEIVKNISAASDRIEAITGVRPTLFRPPYGEYDDHVIRAVRSMGVEPIQWDVDSLDWKDLSAQDIYKRVTSKAAPGSIVLFHNAAKHTPEALGDIIEFLLSEGYTIVPVSELILKGDYTIDHTGRQFPAG